MNNRKPAYLRLSGLCAATLLVVGAAGCAPAVVTTCHILPDHPSVCYERWAGPLEVLRLEAAAEQQRMLTEVSPSGPAMGTCDRYGARFAPHDPAFRDAFLSSRGACSHAGEAVAELCIQRCVDLLNAATAGTPGSVMLAKEQQAVAEVRRALVASAPRSPAEN